MAQRPFDNRRIDRRVHPHRKLAQQRAAGRLSAPTAQAPHTVAYDSSASRSRFKAQKRRKQRSRHILLAAIAIVIAVVAAAFAVVQLTVGESPASQQVTPQDQVNLEAQDAAITDEELREIEIEKIAEIHDSYELAWEDIFAIPETGAIEAFDLSGAEEAAPFEGEAVQAIEGALAAIEGKGSCGFIFMDLDTGCGIAHNPDEALYIASSAKAVLSYHAILDGAAENAYTRSRIEAAIINSSNTDYEAFGMRYTTEDYGQWLESHGVEVDYYWGDLYPEMSARSLASIWAEIYRYLLSGTETADWFDSLLASTGTSFIRDGIADTGAQTRNKAGWIAEPNYSSVTDSALISADGRTFLMTIVTDLPDWSENRQNVSELARTLFSARNDLG